MRRIVGAAVVSAAFGLTAPAYAHGKHHATGGSAKASGSSELTVTEQQLGPDDYVKQWSTPPGSKPQVRVTVERKGYEKYAQAMKQRNDQLRVERDQLVLGPNGEVLFALDSSELLPNGKRQLDQLASVLKDSDAKFTVEGHADSTGTPEHNQQLSEARAEAVKDYLASKGMNADNIEAVGKGEEQPVASNDTPEGRADNRRAEIILPQGPIGIGGSGVGGSGAAGTSCEKNERGR